MNGSGNRHHVVVIVEAWRRLGDIQSICEDYCQGVFQAYVGIHCVVRHEHLVFFLFLGFMGIGGPRRRHLIEVIFGPANCSCQSWGIEQSSVDHCQRDFPADVC